MTADHSTAKNINCLFSQQLYIQLAFKLSMTNRLLAMLGPSKQWNFGSRYGQNTLIYSITNQQFIPYKILRSQFTREELSAFENRQFEQLPHTPKIKLISNNQISNDQILLLVQIAQFDLQRLVQQNQSENYNLLSFVLNIFITAEILHRKYGSFIFTEPMIKIAKGPSLIMWINQDFTRNVPQFPISFNTNSNRNPIQSMISSILCILFLKLPKLNVLQKLRQSKGQQLNFQKIKREILTEMKMINYQSNKFVKSKKGRINQSKIPSFLSSSLKSPLKLNLKSPRTDRHNPTKSYHTNISMPISPRSQRIDLSQSITKLEKNFPKSLKQKTQKFKTEATLSFGSIEEKWQETLQRELQNLMLD